MTGINSKQYKRFNLLAGVCSSLARNILDAKNAGLDNVTIDMSRNDTKLYMKNVLANINSKDSMSLIEAGAIFRAAFGELQKSAREYVNYKMKEHTLFLKMSLLNLLEMMLHKLQ